MYRPWFKVDWCSNDDQKRSAEVQINRALEKYKEPEVCSGDEESQPPPAKKAKTSFFGFKTPKKNRKRHASSAQTELEDYLAEECIDDEAFPKFCPLGYWKTNEHKFPKLAKLAKVYLAIPASSAESERVFSIAGKIFTPTRCLLKPDTFEKLMNIKCNMLL